MNLNFYFPTSISRALKKECLKVTGIVPIVFNIPKRLCFTRKKYVWNKATKKFELYCF